MCCDGQNKRHGLTSIALIVNHATVNLSVSSTTPKYLNYNDYWRSLWTLKN